jgi:hypothetical protein
MRFELHPACSAWPEMKPEELRDLADDIATHGLRDPITLTPDGLLLDGRNRTLACELASVELATTIFDGDPWLFSLSRNKHRRHMTTDQIALVAAKLATRTVGNPIFAIASNEAIGNAEAAKAAGVPETAIDSAKVVLQHGTPEERKAVESGKAKLRRTADRIRARRRADAEPDRLSDRPAAPLRTKAPVDSGGPIEDVMVRELITKCAGPKSAWRTLERVSSIVQRAKSATKNALTRLGDAVKTRAGDVNDEYLIEGDRDELLVRAELMMAQPDHSAADPSDEVSSLRAENADLHAKLADAGAETSSGDRAVEERAAAEGGRGDRSPIGRQRRAGTVDDVVAAALH